STLALKISLSISQRKCFIQQKIHLPEAQLNYLKSKEQQARDCIPGLLFFVFLGIFIPVHLLVYPTFNFFQ
ncbi:MAG: hypothetical protein WCS30_03770, partial [Selenomonadaceae bacterium]